MNAKQIFTLYYKPPIYQYVSASVVCIFAAPFLLVLVAIMGLFTGRTK